MIYIFTLFYTAMSFASFSLPQSLTTDERKTTMDTLGLSTASKFLSSAYPLGGYSGLEVSVSAESFAVSNLKTLGTGSSSSAEVVLPQITIGKGLYNHSDIFVNFVPFDDNSRISLYGLQYRASLYQADFFPLNFSLLLHGNSANFNNQLNTRTLGGDLMIGAMIGDFSFNIGAGYVDSSGNFVGGANGTTDSGVNERSSTSSLHLGMGAVYRLDMVIFGLSIDRYQQAVTKLKIGLLL